MSAESIWSNTIFMAASKRGQLYTFSSFEQYGLLVIVKKFNFVVLL